MAKRLFVGSLPFSTTSAQLEELFSQVGKILSLNLITDRYSGQSRGFAFIEMSSDAESDEAIKKFNNFEIEGRRIVVNVAKPQEDRSGSSLNRSNYARSGNRW